MRILPIEVSKDNTYHDDSLVYLRPGKYAFKANIKAAAGERYDYVTLWADRGAMTAEKLVNERILLKDTPTDREITATVNFTQPAGLYKLELSFSGTLNEPWTLTRKPINPSIDIPENEIIMEYGETRQLNVTITPTGLTKRFESSDNAILSIDENGYMTTNALGEATVTVIVPEQTFDGDKYLATTSEIHVKIIRKIQTTCQIADVENPLQLLKRGFGHILWTPDSYDLSHAVYLSSKTNIATAGYWKDNKFYVFGVSTGVVTITIKLQEYTENGINYLPSETSFDITITD